MKTLEVEWRPEVEDTIPVRIARSMDPDLPEPETNELRHQTKLIVVTQSGVILHRCVHPL